MEELAMPEIKIGSAASRLPEDAGISFNARSRTARNSAAESKPAARIRARTALAPSSRRTSAPRRKGWTSTRLRRKVEVPQSQLRNVLCGEEQDIVGRDYQDERSCK